MKMYLLNVTVACNSVCVRARACVNLCVCVCVCLWSYSCQEDSILFLYVCFVDTDVCVNALLTQTPVCFVNKSTLDCTVSFDFIRNQSSFILYKLNLFLRRNH